MKKITIATVKSFIKMNPEFLFINIKSRFDGMTDGVEDRHAGFQKIRKATQFHERTMGYEGVNFTSSTKNWCERYEDEFYQGFRVDNCCGCFIVAILKRS